jgi:hypothetical protein
MISNSRKWKYYNASGSVEYCNLLIPDEPALGVVGMNF